MTKENSTVRGYNAAKAKLRKAAILMEESASYFHIDGNRHRRIIEAIQKLEEVYKENFGEDMV